MREWSDMTREEWGLPTRFASPPLAVSTFPTPSAARLTRSVDQAFRYESEHGFAIPTQMTETIADTGSTVIDVTVHADFMHWLPGITDRMTVTSTTVDGRTQTRTAAFEWGYPPADGDGPVRFPHLLRLSTREPTDTGPLFQTTEHDRDDRGLVIETAIADHAGNPRISATEYDSEGIYPRHLTDPMGHERWVGVEPALGVVVFESDVRDVETRRQFDHFGRLRSERGHGQSVAMQYLAGAADLSQIESVASPSTGGEQRSTFDPFGRLRQTRSAGFAGAVTSATTCATTSNPMPGCAPCSTTGVPARAATRFSRSSTSA